ncbi:MAG: MBL fold metallo-hydrolase [Chloroflexales bacterium]|nr:MBL fold metallo-hydrolase [Chloroflexales bacterium]
MAVTQVAANLYRIPLGIVNAYLIDHDGLTLIDTGVPGSAPKILAAVAALGRRPADLGHILVTHLHIDHTGSLAALKAATGAKVWMHAADAALVREGRCARPLLPVPGLLPWAIHTFLMGDSPPIEPVETDHVLMGAAELPVAGGVSAIPAPGHSAGQLAFLWPRHGGVLLVGDAAANWRGRLGPGLVFEDLDEGGRTLLRLAALDFQIACFGHGSPIVGDASGAFRARWPGARRPAASEL